MTMELVLPDIRETYENCKHIVKLWEHKFVKKYKRLPSKLDLKEAPRDIRNAYRRYFQLKTSALEQTFIDVDGFHSDEESIDNKPEEIMEEPPDILPETWGTHLNIELPKPVDTPMENKPKVSATLTKKLFCGSKFTKRNPRKSLSQRKSFTQPMQSLSQPEFVSFQSEEALNDDVNEGFRDNFRVVSASQHVQTQPLHPINFDSNSLKKVDTGWLERVAKSLDNQLETKLDYDSDDIIDNSDEEAICTQPKFPHIAKKMKTNDVVVSSQEKIEKEPENNESKFKAEVAKSPVGGALLKGNERRSCRTNKNKVSMQEFSSGDEVDPFHAGTDDDDDPEFTMEKPKKFQLKNLSESDTSDDSLDKTKLIKSQSFPKTDKKKLEEIKKNRLEETPVYELEYSVKPRVSAPRYNNIKVVLSKAKKNKEKLLGNKPEIKDKVQQAQTKLQEKISAGNLNENFVRINLKKKVFVRGRKNLNFSKYKKAQYKNKKKTLAGPDMDMGGCDGGMLTCFNCGQVGHFAQKCQATTGEALLPLTADDQEEHCPFPTLEEAADMANDKVLQRRVGRGKQGSSSALQKAVKSREELENDFGDESDDEELLLQAMKLEEHVKKLDVALYMDNVKEMQPYYSLKEDGTLKSTPAEVLQALNQFGHSSFRPGQEQAIMRILSGQSTLLTLSTGSGKSLCYQLPAYLYSKREPCISLIISPLVSLMEDQITGIPSFVRAACLHTNQTKVQRMKVLNAINGGDLSILLVSPEAVVAGEKQSGFGSLLRKLPPIAFACIDEAHCVSQWSHNFRPSYLLICRVLRESLGVKTILGLTATATKSTAQSIIEHLQIPDGRNGVISDVPIPDNLHLTVSKDVQRDQALLALLETERFNKCHSVIVYCTRRDECERIAAFLRTSMRTIREVPVMESNKKRKRIVNHQLAEPYHAGLSASRRRTIQSSFMSGKLRIVVATVAFGMGINKSDIRAVIHYNMPNSFESYVQEVGRAGRDGLAAQCHLFLDAQQRDESELRRHIYANATPRHVIRKLLERIFVPCSCTGICPKHEVAFSVESTVRALDIPEENIATLLCYLELHPDKYVELLSPAYTHCKVVSYGGPLQIRKAAKECPPLAMALALHQRDESNVLEFPVVDVAAAMGWDSGICKHKLKNLEWTASNNGAPHRSTLTVEFSNLGFRLLAPGNLSDDELDNALDSLYLRVQTQEQTALQQLSAVHQTLIKVAQPNFRLVPSNPNELKLKIRQYFTTDDLPILKEVPLKILNEERLVEDVRTMVTRYRDNQFSGRAIARIFYGIQSPNYPAMVWGRCKFWRSRVGEDFHEISRIATREILNMR